MGIEADVFFGRIERDGILVATNNAEEVASGVVFNRLVVFRRRHAGSGAEYSVESDVPVDLRLREVIVFRRTVDVLPRGWSAGLRLEGDGLDRLIAAIEHRAPLEWVHLRRQV